MKNSNIISIFFIFMLIFSALSCRAEIKRLTPQNKKHLLNDNFRIITRIDLIPETVKQEFARIAHAHSFKMADPMQPFQVTDVVVKRGLPLRRLVFAGVSQNYYFIYYEHGGIGRGEDFVLFKRVDAKARFVWGGFPQSGHALSTLPEIRQYIRKDKFYDMAGLIW